MNSNQKSGPKKLLTVRDVASWLNVSRSLVYQLAEAKQLPVCRIGNGRGAIRFKPEDIEDYIAASVDRRQPINVSPPSKTRLKHIRISKNAS